MILHLDCNELIETAQMQTKLPSVNVDIEKVGLETSMMVESA